MTKFAVVAVVLVIIHGTVNVDGVTSTTTTTTTEKVTVSATTNPRSVRGWIQFLNQAMRLLPSSMPLEDLLGKVAIPPSLDATMFGFALKSLNISVPNTVELNNLLVVLTNFLKIVDWGSSQFPNGTIRDLDNFISTTDEQSMGALLQSLNVELLTDAQFRDAPEILTDLIRSVVINGQPKTTSLSTSQSTPSPTPMDLGWPEFLERSLVLFPKSMTLDDLLHSLEMIPTLDEQTFTQLLQSLKINIPSSSAFQNTLKALGGLLKVVTWGSSQLPGGTAGDLVKIISAMDDTSKDQLIQSLNVDPLSTVQFADALTILIDVAEANGFVGNGGNSGNGNADNSGNGGNNSSGGNDGNGNSLPPSGDVSLIISTTTHQPSVRGWLQFLNQSMRLLPSSMPLEDLLGTMKMPPSLNAAMFGAVLQSLNISVPNSVELNNLLVVLTNFLKIVDWGSTQFPNGTIRDLDNFISTTDEQSMGALLQSLNVELLTDAQFRDAPKILTDLITSVAINGQPTTTSISTSQSTPSPTPMDLGWPEFLEKSLVLFPKSMTLDELLYTLEMLPTLDEQTFAQVLQSLKIDIPSSSAIQNTLEVLRGLLKVVTWGSSQLPGGTAGDLSNLISAMDDTSKNQLIQSLNVDPLNSVQFADALSVLEDIAEANGSGGNGGNSGNGNTDGNGNTLPPGADLNSILTIISMMDPQELQSLLQNMNISLDSMGVNELLSVVKTLQTSFSNGSIPIPNGNINEALNMMADIDLQNITMFLQNLNIDGLDPAELNNALSYIQAIQGSTTGGNSAETNLINNVNLAMLSATCSADIQVIISEAIGQRQWALRLIDSWAKPPSGIMDFNVLWHGSYDQCRSINSDAEAGSPFKVQYCVSGVAADVFDHIPFLGMCLPVGCNEGDVRNITNSVLNMIPQSEPVDFNYARCKREPEYDPVTIVGICVCSLVLALLTFATVYDMYFVSKVPAPSNQSSAPSNQSSVSAPDESVSKAFDNLTFISVESKDDGCQAELEEKVGNINAKNNSTLEDVGDIQKSSKNSGLAIKLFLCFSAWTNGQKLLRTDQHKDSISAICGLRVISILWIIYTHTLFVNTAAIKNVNLISFFDQLQSTALSMPLINGAVAIDTFFVISGLLLSYMLMKELTKQKGRINWFMFYFYRFWRLTPTYMMIILLDVAFSRYYHDGPSWTQMEIFTDNCKESWWTNLLFINNYINTADKKCFPWSWYIACDMQLYILSPLLLVPCYSSKKIGAVLSSLALAGGTVATVFVAMDYPPTNTIMVPKPTFNIESDLNNIQQTKDFHNGYLFKPYSHIAPYVLGLITGYILFKTGRNYKIRKTLNVFIWVLVGSLGCLVVYGLYDDFKGNQWSSEVLVAYYCSHSAHKIVWGACICWVVFACATGNAGFINTLLSWSPFVPLSRLVLCAYLIHPLVMMAYAAQLRQGVYANFYSSIYMFIGHSIVTLTVSFFISLAFEWPANGLERTIFTRTTKNK
ncbi:LOW QUALITY PROTEIN: uncharacterized protein [Argopecten irradians]|uniref:LOW QUALITY PROTEIN: uncharacterized protein n=1 Tax=Argopecten irradians TaxID=31199 RepID=UPI00371628D1